jgi:hypothetical protein
VYRELRKIMKKIILLIATLFFINSNAQDANSIVRQHLINENDLLNFVYQNVAEKTRFISELNSMEDCQLLYANHLGADKIDILAAKMRIVVNSAEQVKVLNLGDDVLNSIVMENKDIIISRPCFECGDVTGGGGCNEEKLNECMEERSQVRKKCVKDCESKAAEESKNSNNSTIAIETRMWLCKSMCFIREETGRRACIDMYCSLFYQNPTSFNYSIDF